MVDVAIIGGGVAGISCALIIGSAIEKEDFAYGKSVIILDSKHSDLNKAIINNAFGFPVGITGEEIMENAEKQINNYKSLTITYDRVIKIIQENNNFKIITFQNLEFNAKIIVLSTGFKGYSIQGLDLETIQHSKTTKSGRVQINNDNYKIKDNLWVCGNLSGISNQFAICAGSGAKVGVNIISEWAGQWKVIHDKIGEIK